MCSLWNCLGRWIWSTKSKYPRRALKRRSGSGSNHSHRRILFHKVRLQINQLISRISSIKATLPSSRKFPHKTNTSRRESSTEGKPQYSKSRAPTTSMTYSRLIQDKVHNPSWKTAIMAHPQPTQAAFDGATMVPKTRLTNPNISSTVTNKTSNTIVCKTIYATLIFSSTRQPLLHRISLQIISNRIARRIRMSRNFRKVAKARCNTFKKRALVFN